MKISLRPLLIPLCAASFACGCVDADPLPSEPGESGVKLSTHVDDWRDEVIYQVIVDRFNNGDINNDFNVDTRSMARYHGGDWQGLIDKLDYLQDLGVTTLWITPPVKNVEEDAGFASYHGYWTVDFLKHNPHFGDLATLRRLSDELHARGMKLILDIVTNHVGQVFYYDINMNGSADEWLAGRGDSDKGSGRTDGELSRVTEYDPDFDAHGINAYTSMGISGEAPVVFFDMPSINRTAPKPWSVDISDASSVSDYDKAMAKKLGFSNLEWYHHKGRTYDYDAGSEGCTDYNTYTCSCARSLTNYDYSDGGYLDGTKRGYCQNDQTLLGDFPGGLKDVATEREDVRQAMIKVFSYWIDVTDCDGFRIDTLKHVEFGFWETFAKGIREHALSRGKENFFMYGEAFDGNDILLASYIDDQHLDGVDSVFLFSQKYAIDSVFKCPPGNTAPYCKQADGSYRSTGTADLYGWDYARKLEGGRHALFGNKGRNNGIFSNYDNKAAISPRDALVNFLDNHDVGRYLYDRNDAGGVDSLKNALSFLILQRGIPCIYYGTEQGFMGGNDPANREDLWDTSASIFSKYTELNYTQIQPYDTKNPLFQHIKKVIAARKAHPVLSRGSISNTKHSDNGAPQSIYAFTRTYNGQKAYIVINTHATQSQTFSYDVSGTEVLNLSEGGCSLSGGSVTVKPMTTCVYVKE